MAICRQVRAKRAATARRGVPAVRTGSRPSRFAAAPCAVPVRRGVIRFGRGNRRQVRTIAAPDLPTATGATVATVCRNRADGHAPPTVTGSDGDRFGTVKATGNRRQVRNGHARRRSRRQATTAPRPICRQSPPTVKATGQPRRRVRQPSRRSDSLPTVTRQTRHNRPPWRSRRSDGFAPSRFPAAPCAVPVRRGVIRFGQSADGFAVAIFRRRQGATAPRPICRRSRRQAHPFAVPICRRRVRTGSATVRRCVCVQGKIKPRQGLSNLIKRNAVLFRERSRRQATARRCGYVQGKSNPVKVYQTSSN